MGEETPRCRSRSLALGESMYGTASAVRGWVLLEEPGPWGIDALRDSRLDATLGAALAEVSRRLRLRVVLIRRHGAPATRPRNGSAPGRRHCYLALTGGEDFWVQRSLLDEATQVLDLDLLGLARGNRPGLEPVEHPLYLVCTQGRHDPCCAEQGRPVARALSRSFPDETWEVSHIGGDRFAGNLVVLPHGLYFGRVRPDDAVPVAQAYARGEIEPAYLRGRAAYGFGVQAAECMLREETGIRGVDDLPLVSARRLGEETEAVFAAPDLGHYRVRVHTSSVRLSRTLTCHATRLATPPEHRLVDLRHEAA